MDKPESHANDLNRTAIIKTILLLIWLGIVVIATIRHEYWRDEVRDLSIARSVSSPFELFMATRNEGHPVLWYFLLYAGKSIVDSPYILPVLSILISFSSVFFLLFFSPFNLLTNCLLVFSSLVLFEDTVMARPYGISLLFLCIIAILYRTRKKNALWLAVMLALLANTNVQSAILTALISLLWITDLCHEWKSGRSKKKDWKLLPAFLIIALGLWICACSVIPRGNSLFMPIMNNLTLSNISSGLLIALARPDFSFSQLMPAFAPPFLLIFIYFLTILGLIKRPKFLVLALLSQVAFGLLFQLVYPASARHQGVFLIFLIFLFWIYLDSETVSDQKHPLPFIIGFNIGFSLLLLGSVIRLKDTLWPDLIQARSSSSALGAFLNNSDQYQNAILVPEPDYLMDALPFYVHNQIYYPREERFGNYVMWTTDSKSDLSLAELLSDAETVKKEYNQPVIIVLGWNGVSPNTTGQIDFSYNKSFSWSKAEALDFDQSTQLITEFSSSYEDENYILYLVE